MSGTSRPIVNMMLHLVAVEESIRDHYNSINSCEEMFAYLWSVEKAHEIFTPELVYSGKSETEAERHRVEGNVFFQTKDLDKALASYNLSIMAAPHPPHQPRKCDRRPNTEDENNPESLCDDAQKCNLSSETHYKTLALAFANRSAVLFELSQYEKCISDIDMALSYGYPKEKHIKLILRKIKCLVALKETQKAEEMFKTKLEELSFVVHSPTGHDDAECDANRKLLADLQKECQSKGFFEGFHLKRSNSQGAAQNCRLMFNCQRPPLPKIQDVNPSMPALASSVKMACTLLKGRILTAAKDIHPGDILLVEESYSSTLFETKLNAHCSCCLTKTVTPLPCPSCSKVIFCGQACVQEGLQGFHHHECSFVIPTLLVLNEYKMLQVFRIMTKTSFSKLKEMIPQLKQETENLTRGCQGFNEKGIYDSKDYRPVYHLMNYKDTTTEWIKLLEECVKAFILTKILQQTPWYNQKDGNQHLPSEEEDILLGSTVLHHTFTLTNNFPLREYQVDGDETPGIGLVIYPVMSLFSHSCNPSTFYLNNGTYGIIRSLCYIPVGNEITMAYNTAFWNEDLDVRRSIMSLWHFHCTCDACEHNWPQMHNLPDEIMFQCVNCQQSFEKDGECLHCPKNLVKARNHKNVSEVLRGYEAFVKIFLERGESSNKMNVAFNVIELMDKYTKLPYSQYFFMQKLIVKEFMTTGYPKML